MIKGSSFHLRHLKKDELPKYLELLNHPDSRGDYLGLELMLPGVAEKKFEAEAVSKEARETFVIVDDQDTLLGQIFHFKTVPYFNSREIGYALFGRQLHGKGIMSEALQLMTDYLFNTMLINRLEVHMNVDNLASEKVAQNCGYQKDGVARGAAFSRGCHIDVSMYSLLREDWEKR